MTDDRKPIACCPADGAPLIWTFAFAGKEWYCLECGRAYPMFGHARREDPTPELQERLAALTAEWDEHAGTKLITPRAYRDGCAKCWRDPESNHGILESHDRHATVKELDADREARAWLATRST